MVLPSCQYTPGPLPDLRKHSLARQGSDDKLIGGLREHNGSKGICLRDIRDRWLEVVREDKGMVEGPKREESRGESDANGKVDGEGTVLERAELLPRQGLERNGSC